MKLPYWLPLLLVVPTACSTMRDTAMLQDDVYTIPDRTVVASTEPNTAGPSTQQAASNQDDYYDPAASRTWGATGQNYYDLTYNDPYYYNYGRFGFGTGISSFGPSYGMGLSYGWPTSFGSMSIGYGAGFGNWGYDPYWNNSWMSGYGYWPYAGYGDPYGYYGYGNYGYGYGGYGMGYGYYQGPWGGCYNCYEPGYGSVVYTHRPSMAGGSAGYATTAPRLLQRPVINPQGTTPTQELGREPYRTSERRQAYDSRPSRIATPQPTAPARTGRTEQRRNATFDIGGDGGTFRGGGSNSGGGGGRVTSPRPR
jgi:hypothetical protein